MERHVLRSHGASHHQVGELVDEHAERGQEQEAHPLRQGAVLDGEDAVDQPAPAAHELPGRDEGGQAVDETDDVG